MAFPGIYGKFSLNIPIQESLNALILYVTIFLADIRENLANDICHELYQDIYTHQHKMTFIGFKGFRGDLTLVKLHFCICIKFATFWDYCCTDTFLSDIHTQIFVTQNTKTTFSCIRTGPLYANTLTLLEQSNNLNSKRSR